MSWFDATSFSKYAKSALKNAQKNIDKVLDIKDDDIAATSTTVQADASKPCNKLDGDEQFFDSFLDESNPLKNSQPLTSQTAIKKTSDIKTEVQTDNDVKNTNKLILKKRVSKNNKKSGAITKISTDKSSPSRKKVEVGFVEESQKETNVEVGQEEEIQKETKEVEAESNIIKENIKVIADEALDIEDSKGNVELVNDTHEDSKGNVELVNDTHDSTDEKDLDVTFEKENDRTKGSITLVIDQVVRNDDKATSVGKSNNTNHSHPILPIKTEVSKSEEANEDEILFEDRESKSNDSIGSNDKLSEINSNNKNLISDDSCKNEEVIIGNSCKNDEVICDESVESKNETQKNKTYSKQMETFEHNIKEPSLFKLNESENFEGNCNELSNKEIKENETFKENYNENFINNCDEEVQVASVDSFSTNHNIKGNNIDGNNIEDNNLKNKDQCSNHLNIVTNENFNVTENKLKDEIDIEEENELVRRGSDTADDEFNTVTSVRETSCEPDTADDSYIASLEKKLKDMKNVVDARENKLFQLSKENIELNEAASIYRAQLDQLQNMQSVDSEEVERMQQEFSVRVGDFESRLKQVIKERDQYKKVSDETNELLNTSVHDQIQSLNQSLLEKEETITGLLSEGDSLSKKELEANNRIKKLKLKLRDVMNESKGRMEQIEKLKKESQQIKEVLIEKEGVETRLQVESKKLEQVTDSQEDEISSLKEKLDDMEEKYKAMESTLQNCYSEINQLNLEKAQSDSIAQEAVSAVTAKDELQKHLEEVKKNSKVGNEELTVQLENLKQAFSRLGQQGARREEHLKNEIQDLLQRIEDGEKRNQELSHSVTTATRPLLRQIENLQVSHTSHAANWEKIEHSLTDRLSSYQHQLDLAIEKERLASDIAGEIKSKFKVLEKQNKSLKEEKIKLQFNVEDEVSKSLEQINMISREKDLLEKQNCKLKDAYDTLHSEKMHLEEESTGEKIHYESEISRLNSILMYHQQLNKQQALDINLPTSNHDESPVHKYNTANLMDVSTASLNESTRSTTTTISMEIVESQLRKQEGEIFILKEEIKSLEKTKMSLAKELVSLTSQVEELEECKEQRDSMKQQHADMVSRYNAVLQMYGEKAEEAEELKMDLIDIKSMYKQQIQQLLGDR